MESLTLVGSPSPSLPRLRRAMVLADATNMARELVNLPGSELSPPELARRARALARTTGLRVEVLGETELRRRGYGAILAVAAGSAHPAQLVVLRYRPAGHRRAASVLGIAGKGITFDSGGISIKPATDLQYMRGDMGGGAAVLAAMGAIAALKPSVEVIGVIAAAENMLSGAAMRPGDVVRTGAGKTIEVVNTDAEGRLALSDAIHHLTTLGATHIVDIATLTGAQRVALGPVAAAAVSSDQAMADLVLTAAAAAGERIWQMPAYPEYQAMLDSRIADLNNSPGRDAGLITAALLLREFTGGLPWVHLDIAAPSWNRVSGVVEIPKGPTGFGVRTLASLAELMAELPAARRGPKAKPDKFSRNIGTAHAGSRKRSN
jgi:leucyl aminopeptidase